MPCILVVETGSFEGIASISFRTRCLRAWIVLSGLTSKTFDLRNPHKKKETENVVIVNSEQYVTIRILEHTIPESVYPSRFFWKLSMSCKIRP